MSWQIYKDENIYIKGTSNGYYTVIFTDDCDDETVCGFDVDDPDYFYNLSEQFKRAGDNLKITLAQKELEKLVDKIRAEDAKDVVKS